GDGCREWTNHDSDGWTGRIVERGDGGHGPALRSSAGPPGTDWGNEVIEQLEELKTRALEDLARIQDLDRLEEWRISYLGKRSELNQILRGIGTLAPADRRAVGQIANDVKSVLEGESAARHAQLKQIARQAEIARERIDVTLPPRPTSIGQRHPLSLITDEIVSAFRALGYDV